MQRHESRYGCGMLNILFALLLCIWSHAAFAQAFFLGQANGNPPMPPAPTLAFTAFAGGSTSSTTTGSGTYTISAPTGLSAATYGGGCTGSATVSGFSAGAGVWSATFTTPASACTGTLNVTGTGPNTASATGPSASFSSGGATAFVPLHHYYMSPTGSDSNNGTSPSTPWQTPNHAVVCGDVIEALAGNYSTVATTLNMTPGVVSNCPSTSAGIDGTGGINFAILLCGGSDLGTSGCMINCGTAGKCVGSNGNTNFGMPTAIDIFNNNWAVEGWVVTGTSDASFTSTLGMIADGCADESNPGSIVHHIAFINNVVFNNGGAFGMADCGANFAVTPGNGADYLAFIGNIAQNAAQGNPTGPQCVAAIDVAGPAVHDTNAGTHIIFYGNFAFANTHTNFCSQAGGSDMENYMFDSWDVHGYTPLGVAVNNMGWDACRFGFEVTFSQQLTAIKQNQVVDHNTMFASGACNLALNAMGEFNLQAGTGSPLPPGNISVTNNIGRANWSFPGNGPSSNGPIYGLLIGGAYGGQTIGGTGNENVFMALSGMCAAICDAGDNAVTFGGNISQLGTNIYTDPLFNNTTDLLTNWVGTPNCSGKASTTLCMGYNPTTATLTTNTPIYDLQPTASQALTKGYQLPSSTCSSGAANGYFPTYLKGVVRLGVAQDGTHNIFQYHDLVTTPCGL